jgi:hypothetical protein
MSVHHVPSRPFPFAAVNLRKGRYRSTPNRSLLWAESAAGGFSLAPSAGMRNHESVTVEIGHLLALAHVLHSVAVMMLE